MAEQTIDQFVLWADGKAVAIVSNDHREAIGEIKAELSASVLAGFDQSHDPDGRPFKPLANDPFRRPLFGTKAKMIGHVLRAHQRAKVTKDELLVQIDSQIAVLHNLGRKKRPKREFLGFGSQAIENAAGKVADKAVKMLLKE